jgi:hypothetical protein
LAATSLATVAMVMGFASITSSTASAKERDEYGRLFLKDVTGEAAIIKYYDKKFGLKFKDGFIYIYNLKCWPYGRCFVEGNISGKIYEGAYWKFILEVKKADFKAPAWLYKEEDYHHGPYAADGGYPPPPPPPPPHKPPYPPKDDCKLSLDIGKIKLVQYDYSYKYKKYPTYVFIDPDPADLYVTDRYYKKQLCDLAKPSYGDEEPPHEHPYVEAK